MTNQTTTQWIDYWTTATVAATLGLKPNTIARYCARYGVGIKYGRDWLLTDDDVQIIKLRMGKRGPKPSRH